MKRQRISLLLTLAMIIGMIASVPVMASDVPYTVQSGTVVSAMTGSAPDENAASVDADTATGSAGSVTAAQVTATYLSPKRAANQLRNAMLERQSSLTLYINVTDYWVTNGRVNWFATDFFPMAYSQELAKCAYDGDYLQWSWSKFDWELLSRSGTQYVFRVDLQYYTTRKQEQTLQKRVSRLANQLGLTSKTPYAAYSAIYDYITAHVRYDHTGLSKIHDGIGGNEDYSIFTAYGALVGGKAVCQGYAMLYYALCRSADLPVRTITSTSHAWNIVYLKGIWYDVDATWDADTDTGRQWYLLGSKNFDGGMHTAGKEYRTSAFRKNYPISKYDYDGDSPYNDVPKTSTHYKNIMKATELGLFNGTDSNTFSPQGQVTRAMLVTVLWRREGSPTGSRSAGYSDVPKTAYYAQAVNWATAKGIVNGVGGGKFSPNSAATREQVVTILYRYADYLKQDLSKTSKLSSYTDRRSISAYALPALRWAVGTGIVKGASAARLAPRQITTRAQLASLLIRFLNYYKL